MHIALGCHMMPKTVYIQPHVGFFCVAQSSNASSKLIRFMEALIHIPILVWLDMTSSPTSDVSLNHIIIFLHPFRVPSFDTKLAQSSNASSKLIRFMETLIHIPILVWLDMTSSPTSHVSLNDITIFLHPFLVPSFDTKYPT